MANENETCELCKKAPRRGKDLFLCQDCAEVVSRVIPCEVYEANHDRDRQAQLAQMQLLVKVAKNHG